MHVGFFFVRSFIDLHLTERGIQLKSFLSSTEAAAYTGLSDRCLKEYRLKGRIPHFRLGHKTIVYLREDLDAYLERHRVKAAGEGN